MIKEKGYVIRNTTSKTFDIDIQNIYKLLTKVYSNFPLYKNISKDQFIKIFGPLRYVLDFEMVKVVYKDEELTGFFIAIPNYGNLLYNINLINLIKIKKIKRNCKDYILLYTGIGKEHLGLGSAMAEIIKQELSNRQCKSIGALIHEGKVTNNYYKELMIDKYEYVLLEKNL